MGYFYKSNFKNSKKAVLDVPLVFMIKMIVGLASSMLILIPIINLFFTEDYNREVANDLSNGLHEFIMYSNSKYNTNMNQCYEPFNLNYLSNPQVYNRDYRNYVVVLTRNSIALIDFNDYLKIISSQDIDFEWFDQIILDDPINLDILNLEEGNDISESGTIEILFFVPSIAIESTLVSGFTGDSKSGYYVRYGVDDGSRITIKPDQSTLQALYKVMMVPIDSILNNENEERTRTIPKEMYDFGFFNYNGLYYGPVKNSIKSSDSLNNCGTHPLSFDTTPQGSNPSHNTAGLMCSVQVSSDMDESFEEIKSNIYWEGGEGYKCASEFDYSRLNDENSYFCDDLKNQYPAIFSSNRDENLEEIKQNFTSFCNSYYNSLIVDNENREVNIENSILQDEGKIVYRTEFNFLDFFEKIDEDDLLTYVEENKNSLFKRKKTPDNCKVTYKDFEGSEDLCDYVVKFTTDGVEKYAFYIDTLEDEYDSFYTLKSESIFEVRRNTEEKYFAIGNRKIEDESSSLRELDCGFWKSLSGSLGANGCRESTFNVVEIEDNFFDDVVHNSFQIYLSKQSKNRGVSNELAQTISTSFKEINQETKKGLNNEGISIQGQNYILNTMFLDITHQKFGNPTFSPSNGDFLTLNSIFKIENFDIEVTYDISKKVDSFMGSEEIEYSFKNNDNEDVEISFPISFEQILHSLYNHQSLEKNKVQNEIENERFRLILSDELSTELVSRAYVVTKETNKLVYEVIEDEQNNQKFVPLVFETYGTEKEKENIESSTYEGKIIFPKYQQNGDLIFEEILYNLSGEEVITMIEESENIN